MCHATIKCTIIVTTDQNNIDVLGTKKYQLIAVSWAILKVSKVVAASSMT